MGTKPIRDDATVELASGTDVTSLELGQREGFLVSRIIGRKQTVGDLLKVAGMLADDARTILARLALRGVVTIKAPGGGPIAEDDEYDGMVFSPGDLNARVDLTLEQKKRILYVEANLSNWNHYGLLGLKRTAEGRDIKKGYFRASKEFHPDAFFRKELGPFKTKVDRIFRAMKAAYDVLNDDKARAKYDETVEVGLTPAEERELRELAKKAAEKKEQAKKDERLQARMKERRLKRNPMIDRLNKARDFIKQAEVALSSQKQAAQAARLAKLAKDYAPQDGGIKARADRIIAEANLERAKAIAGRADAIVASYDDDKIIEYVDELEELAPRDAGVLLRAARMANSAHNAARALKLASRAAALDDENVKARELVFLLAAGTKSWHTALKAAEWLKERDPKNGEYKKMVKDAKRNL